nr:class I tRNA ligase family protein [Bacteroidota bacterium]
GYKNLTLLKKLGTTHSKFFHVPKNQNRHGHFDLFVFQLKNDEHKELSAEEKSNHEPVWLSPKDLETFNLPSSHRDLWDTYRNGGKPKEHTAMIFTTRPDTIFGATYLVLAPEHPLVKHFIHQASNATEIDDYLKKTSDKSEIERTTEGKEKSGVEIKGVKAINPATGEEIPIYVADYVLAHYGTGAIMAVPAHDERDFEFAKKFNLQIREVLAPYFVDPDNLPVKGKPVQRRNNIRCIIKHWSEDKYLCIKWKPEHYGGKTYLVTGGVEEGEDPIKSAIREIQEETGYQNVKFVQDVPGTFHAEYYAGHKGVNRYAVVKAFVFDLENGEHKEKSDEDKKLHDNVWVSKTDLKKEVQGAEVAFLLDRFLGNDKPYTGEAELINSGKFSGMKSEEAKKAITKSVGGKIVTTYKLRDWIFSRQRYWGEPIPMIHCDKCGWVPVPEKDLPVKLPDVKNYLPTDTGESPLAQITKWVNTKCPQCKGPAKRETDTMPNWAGSSWYYLRYADPHNKKAFAARKKLDSWIPVDWYNGGMAHTTLHLLYSRFWHKFLYDLKLVPEAEPYQKRTSHGLIMAEGGEKMSKSKGNVVNPDPITETYGADTLRLYEMFMGPFDQPVAWSMEGIIGPRRFLEKVWRLQEKVVPKWPFDAELESIIHKTIKKVSDDIEAMSFNTAVSSMMILVNEMDKKEKIALSYYKHVLQLLAPFAPFITEEIWANLGNKKSIHLEDWPKYSEAKMKTAEIKIIVQVNGKMRGEFMASPEISENEAEQKAQNVPGIEKWIEGKEVKRVVYVKGRLVNIVI